MKFDLFPRDEGILAFFGKVADSVSPSAV